MTSKVLSIRISISISIIISSSSCSSSSSSICLIIVVYLNSLMTSAVVQLSMHTSYEHARARTRRLSLHVEKASGLRDHVLALGEDVAEDLHRCPHLRRLGPLRGLERGLVRVLGVKLRIDRPINIYIYIYIYNVCI